jgi:hypothetical protein
MPLSISRKLNQTREAIHPDSKDEPELCQMVVSDDPSDSPLSIRKLLPLEKVEVVG